MLRLLMSTPLIMLPLGWQGSGISQSVTWKRLPWHRKAETSPWLQERLGSDNTSSLSESPRITSAPNTPASSSADTVAVCTHSKCKKRYTGRVAHINLRRHIRCIHESTGKEWRCPGVGCSLKTKRRDNLRVHFLKKHPGETMLDWLLDTRRARKITLGLAIAVGRAPLASRWYA
jgi:hypothetical protein